MVKNLKQHPKSYQSDMFTPSPGIVYQFDLKDKSEIVEISVPTCNYRNGQVKTAYGAAVLGMKKEASLKYAV